MTPRPKQIGGASAPLDPLGELDRQVKDQARVAAAALQLSTARAAFVLGKRGNPEEAGTYAFFASLVLKLKLERRDSFGTMATDGKTVWWALDYVESLDPFQTLSEVAHETAHCFLFHPARMQALLGPNPDQARVQRAQVAADCAVDPMMRDAGFWNPPTAIFPAQFDLPEGLTFEEYFHRLPENLGKRGGAAMHGQILPAGADPKGKGGDPAQAQAQEAEWKVAVEQARRAAKMRGTLPAALDSLCDAVLANQVDWRLVLREFFTVLARDDYRWSPPNRRHVAAGLYLPSCQSERLGRLVTIVDTSGSMSEGAVRAGLGEVQAILQERPTVVDLLLHDSRLYRSHTVDVAAGEEFPPIKTRRGGTSHREAFAWIADNAPDAVAGICFTDCESDLEDVQVPDFPVFFFKPAGCRSNPPAWAAAVAELPDLP